MRRTKWPAGAESIRGEKKDRMAIREETPGNFDSTVNTILVFELSSVESGPPSPTAVSAANIKGSAAELRRQLPRKYHYTTTTRGNAGRMPALWRNCVDYCVHCSSCAFHSAVRNVFGGYRGVFRHISRRANRSRLNAADTNG